MLVSGRWHVDDVRHTAEGEFIHTDSRIRNWITADGEPGPTGEGGFRAEPNRYHLYVSPACPFAHRTIVLREIKGLTELISASGMNPYKGEHGWTFEPAPGVSGDPLLGARFLYQIYTHAEPTYTGRVTVPVLWDRKRETIVSNDSGDIMRMFNSTFDDLGAIPDDLFPDSLRAKIDRLSRELHEAVNLGVYRAGFARAQSAYETAVTTLFEYLGQLEDTLSKQRYLCGNRVTGVDWQLFTTLVRFDPVYYIHFKCNRRRLVDFPNLWAYTRDLYQQPGVSRTVDIAQIKAHYYQSHRHLNPLGLIPVGPEIDFQIPHYRNRESACG
jgi:putative glutathione S-transferase